MNKSDVKDNVKRVIREVAELQNLEIPLLNENHEIVDDLGFTSLSVAALLANFEEVFGIDPFEDENVMLTDMRTIKDICNVYSLSLEKKRLSLSH